jgi:hypothetical protein
MKSILPDLGNHGSFTYLREMAPVKEVREAFAKGAVT